MGAAKVSTALTRIIKNIRKGEQLVITPRIDQYLLHHPDGIHWDTSAFEALTEIVGVEAKNSNRANRFGASSRGSCQRRQVFQFLGMPQEQILSPVTVNLFMDGKLRHLKWQIMGMQAGIFTHVEHPVEVPQYRLKCSLDALNADEAWFFELKGDSNWTKALEGIVPERHNLQIHTCMLATGWDMCVYVIEDKRSQEWREIIVRKDPVVMRQVKKELAQLNEAIDYQRLPPILSECQAKQGPYTTCPYNKRCLGQEDWYDNEWPEEGKWPDD